MVIDQAIHSLDLVRYLMGCEPVKVKGHIDRRILTNIEVEDVADAAITFENGAVYSFFACNYYTSNSPIRVEISGCLLYTSAYLGRRSGNGRDGKGCQYVQPDE